MHIYLSIYLINRLSVVTRVLLNVFFILYFLCTFADIEKMLLCHYFYYYYNYYYHHHHHYCYHSLVLYFVLVKQPVLVVLSTARFKYFYSTTSIKPRILSKINV